MPPVRPPKPLELVSVPVDEAPVIDGRVDDAVWARASEMTTLDFGSQREIQLKSVYTEEDIFFLVTFPDQARSSTHQTWGWDSDDARYKPMTDREDVFVFKWSLVGNQISLALQGAEPHRADLWFWQAHRTNRSGVADDQMQLVLPEPHDDATRIESPTHGPLYLRRVADRGQGPYDERPLAGYQADYLPRYYPREPTGSRADIRAKGVWKAKQWTIEFARKLRTWNEDDIAFEPGARYLFAVSCYAMDAGLVDPTLTQPLYASGDAFDRLLLKLAKRPAG